MEELVFELLLTIPIILWEIFVIKVLTKKLYHVLKSKGLPENVVVYYNRKIIHIAAGGAVLLVPIIYKEPWIPVGLTLLLTALVVKSRKKEDKFMYWFQTKDNDYEVHFLVMTVIMLSLGYALGDPWCGVLPIAFMAIGDGVTGIIRNALFKRRTKSWWGNLGMLITNVIIGSIKGVPGMISGAVAAIVEKFEFFGGKIDDNVTVPLVSFILLYALCHLV